MSKTTLLDNKVEIKTHSDFENATLNKNIPTSVIQDVNRRICDWLAGGGSHDDEYIYQQYRYIENYCNLKIGKK